MKIVCKDNFDRESIADRLVVANIQNKNEGEAMLAGLRQELCSDESSDWYILVEDDYSLSRGMEDLV